ncbi:MAG: MarR family winged helix-turn-helix transcriptional regulator [Lachnospiraceae bacterium]|nr:MarR family winged helix-turn-helix transcriptional regulator [Lachnospiraceae bacterium]
MLASAGVKAPADELPKAAMVHEQVAKRIANVRFTQKRKGGKQMELMTFWNFVTEFDKSYDIHRKKIMGSFQLTAVEVDVLLFLANNPMFNTSSDIIRLRKIAKSHVSLAVNGLVEKGYLTRNTDEKNKKLIRLEPTPAAQEVIAFGRVQQAQFARVIEKGIREEDKPVLRETMIRITEALHQAYSGKEKSR